MGRVGFDGVLDFLRVADFVDEVAGGGVAGDAGFAGAVGFRLFGCGW